MKRRNSVKTQKILQESADSIVPAMRRALLGSLKKGEIKFIYDPSQGDNWKKVDPDAPRPKQYLIFKKKTTI